MQPSDTIKEYCSQIGGQIRWKKARSTVAAEIENHLYDQRDAYMANGDDERSATQKAIAQMGNAVLVGQELDKTHRPRPQWLMLALTGILMMTGMSVNYFIDTSMGSLDTFQALPYFLAFGLFACCYCIDFTMLEKHPRKIYTFVLLASIIGVALGTGVNGKLAWLVGRFSVSMLPLPLIFPMAFALFVYSMRNKGLGGILICGIAYLPFAFILIYIPTLSGLLLYTITALTVLCFSICRGWFGVQKKRGLMLVLIPTASIASFAGIFFISNLSHRLSIYFNPAQDILGAGYRYYVIRNILSGAVFSGNGGIPQNIGDISALPSIGSDYSLVYLIHRLGIVAFICITLLIALFAVLGIRKALKERSVLGSLISLTIIATFILQAVFYIADNLGYGLLSSPLSLPFISHGNPALFINAAMMGFMLSIFRTGEIFRDDCISPGEYSDGGSHADHSLFSYQDGKLIVNLKRSNS